MTAAENPLDVLREALAASWAPQPIHESARAALSAVEQLVEAARELHDWFRTVGAEGGDPIHDIYGRLSEALARFPVPAQDTGRET